MQTNIIIMNNVDKQYFDLIRHIKEKGVEKKDRTGTGTISVFSYDMRFDMQDGFPLLTSKKMAWKSMVIELLWFLKGDTNIKYLVDNGCYIWVGDAYKNYKNTILETEMKKSLWELTVQAMSGKNFILSKEEFINKIKTDNDFAKKWGELGPVYGKQWRKWTNIDNTEMKIHTLEVDQITNLINDLKTNPDSRRLMVNAWNVGDLEQMVLPPCHYGFQCYTRELTTKERNQWYFDTNYQNPAYKVDWKDYELDQQNVPKRALSLKWTQRSCDCGLGIPFNIASYGLLLHLLAKEVNMIPDELIFSGGDCHIYSNHLDAVTKQLHNQTYNLPKVVIANKSIFDITYEDIKLVGYQSAEKIDMPLSN